MLRQDQQTRSKSDHEPVSIIGREIFVILSGVIVVLEKRVAGLSKPENPGALMNRFDKIDDPRRRLLVEALTVGLIATSFPTGNAHAQLFGRRPTQLPPGQSIYRIAGTALVNGKAATLQTLVRPGDTVETGKDSEIVFVVSGHSMIMRPETHLVIESERKGAASLPAAGLRMRMRTGQLLSVSRDSPMRITTSTAAIDIRGTGWYAESDPEKTYFCTCYGVAEIAANNDPGSKETVVSKQHDRPLSTSSANPLPGRASATRRSSTTPTRN